jgi:hypothetical protein
VSALSDWELWACARQQIDQNGIDTAIFLAAIRADALLAEGDMAGHSIWILILDRIRQLSKVAVCEVRH